MENNKQSMGTNSGKVQSVLESTFTNAINKLAADQSGNLISDLYIQVDQETGELELFDDEEHLLEKVVIFDWVKNAEEEESFNQKVIAILKNVLTVMVAKELFNDPRFLKPLSVSLTDEDFVVIEELLFLDDDTLRIDDPLLKDLDKDLDNFLDKLLSDVD